jgi:outer membrane lipoprotein-sorting protein
MIRTIIALFVSLITFSSTAQNALEIVEKSEELLRGNSSHAKLEIKIIRPSWERTMQMESWSSGNDYALILITEPVKEKGTVFLKRHDELWNWIPRISRTIKLPPSMMSQSWMGTDMSNDDLVRQSSIVTDYHHKILGSATINERDCHILELIPKEEAAVVWGKVKMWVDKETYIQLKVEQFDEDNELVNTALAYDIIKVGKRVIPTKFEITPADESGNKTIMEYKFIEFDIDISDSFFSLQNMKRVR